MNTIDLYTLEGNEKMRYINVGKPPKNGSLQSAGYRSSVKKIIASKDQAAPSLYLYNKCMVVETR